MTPDDFELMAYVDGELDAPTSKRIAEAVDGDPELRAKVDALIESRDVARAAYAPAEEAPLSPALQEMIDGLHEDLDASEPDPAWRGAGTNMDGGARILSWTRSRLAALVGAGAGFGAIAAWMLTSQVQPQPFLVLTDANIVELSNQAQRVLTETPAGRDVDGLNVDVSFLSNDGAACRQFRVSAQAGIACREGADWRLVILTDTTDEEQFQAAGGSNAFAQATATLGVSKILSEEEEAARIAIDWQPPVD